MRITHGQVLRRALSTVDGLDRPLPLGYARPEHAEVVADDLRDALAEATATLAATDVAGLVSHEVDRARRRRSALPIGQLRSVLALDQLDAATVVVGRVDQPAALVDEHRDDGRLTLQLPDRRLHLPASCRAALERLLACEPVRVDALPDLDEPSQVVLTKRLVREGLLVIADG